MLLAENHAHSFYETLRSFGVRSASVTGSRGQFQTAVVIVCYFGGTSKGVGWVPHLRLEGCEDTP